MVGEGGGINQDSATPFLTAQKGRLGVFHSHFLCVKPVSGFEFGILRNKQFDTLNNTKQKG